MPCQRQTAVSLDPISFERIYWLPHHNGALLYQGHYEQGEALTYSTNSGTWLWLSLEDGTVEPVNLPYKSIQTIRE